MNNSFHRYLRFLNIPLFLLLYSCIQKVPTPEPLYPVPTQRQVNWHQMEMNAFIHFTTNTFTDKEWGYGNEKPEVFNPSDFNADSMVHILQIAGFKGMVLTCKHHDGFCLWPSEYTEHSVKNSGWKNGTGDVVDDFARACKKYGLKFGIYLSPWDRNRADYGQAGYIEYYRNQLKELFGKYGPVFEMWFDGANGGDGYYGGADEKRRIDGKTYYDWPGTLQLVRNMEPDIIFFSDAGPDIRWCGNEKGYAGEPNWNTITTDTLYAGKPGITDLLNHGSEDGESWVPAEVDVSIRPGWFYHASEDSLVKQPGELFEIYINSVGRGSNLLLNIPPDRTGNFHHSDIKSILEWRKILDETFSEDLAAGSKILASGRRGRGAEYSPSNMTDGEWETYWATDDDVRSAEFEIILPDPEIPAYIVLQEYIPLGQRVRKFRVEAKSEDTWVEIAGGTTIGYNRILSLSPVRTNRIRVNILDSKACPLISTVELYGAL